ncbi:hypothetical protein [Sphaerisporangium dianthi]|uniref:Uncharacterized protein n=1 Tax=Sphaerisporangium dianthi TaxID=1436120 RepID=A0ABV9CTP2_9ACTN
MRDLTISGSSWTVDESGNAIDAGRRESSDAVEAATIDYGYARI